MLPLTISNPKISSMADIIANMYFINYWGEIIAFLIFPQLEHINAHLILLSGTIIFIFPPHLGHFNFSTFLIAIGINYWVLCKSY